MKTHQYIEKLIETEINSHSFNSLKINQWERKYLIDFIKQVGGVSDKKGKTIQKLEQAINKRNRLIKKLRNNIKIQNCQVKIY